MFEEISLHMTVEQCVTTKAFVLSLRQAWAYPTSSLCGERNLERSGKQHLTPQQPSLHLHQPQYYHGSQKSDHLRTLEPLSLLHTTQWLTCQDTVVDFFQNPSFNGQLQKHPVTPSSIISGPRSSLMATHPSCSRSFLGCILFGLNLS